LFTFFYFLSGNNADIIKNGGYKLSALEIESVIVEVIGFHFFILWLLVVVNNSLHSCMVYDYDMIFTIRTFLQHPTVSECCVLGLPDKDYGEIVCAIVVPVTKQDKESKSALSLEEVSTWAKSKLAPYKVWWHGHCLHVLYICGAYRVRA
jgi:malonyl-CoA/methylmalonyl-CoA synthetase